jgi:hypothetical protein
MLDEKNGPSAHKEMKPVFGRWTIAAIMGILVIIILILAANTLDSPTGKTAVVSPAVCSDKVIAYVNTNLVSAGETATLINVTNNNDIYRIWSRYQGRDLSIYATRDCTLLFTTAFNMNAAAASQAPTQPPKKSERPVADLYVMGVCPYGTQAETAMRPVVDLLGTKADISVRYITTVNGNTVDTVDSLHGPAEAKEDLRQLCIMRSYPAKYWNYLAGFNEQCYPVWQNASLLDTCRKNVTTSLGIDLSAIDTCATSADSIALLRQDEVAAESNGATASPTLLINGVTYNGARTPEGYKQAICNSFDTAPAECNTTLSSASAATTGGCQ